METESLCPRAETGGKMELKTYYTVLMATGSPGEAVTDRLITGFPLQFERKDIQALSIKSGIVAI